MVAIFHLLLISELYLQVTTMRPNDIAECVLYVWLTAVHDLPIVIEVNDRKINAIVRMKPAIFV